jgi:hypothetical protein
MTITWHHKLGSMPVYKDPFISKFDEDGKKVLARIWDSKVLVHPDHWDEFCEKINSGRREP